MGNYTGLRVRVTVKEECREMIKDINEGTDWSEYAEQFPFLAKYSEDVRAEFIPGGALCYTPSHWTSGDFPNEVATDGFIRNIDMETGKWTFQCSLKNHNRLIQQFFREVLPNIITESEHIEYRFEYDEESTMYVFNNGEIGEVM